MSNGIFITIEGGEGSGKTTQAAMLARRLMYMGKDVRVTREPGGTDIAEQIRSILKNSRDLDPISETLMLFTARREHFIKLISPLLQKGGIVISDRFYDSSLAYQGALKKVPIEQIMYLKNIVLGDFEPDLTIVLDVSPEIAKTRVIKRSLFHDDYDEMSESEYQTIREAFVEISKIFSFRSVLINANGNKQNVFKKVFRVVQKIL